MVEIPISLPPENISVSASRSNNGHSTLTSPLENNSQEQNTLSSPSMSNDSHSTVGNNASMSDHSSSVTTETPTELPASSSTPAYR